MGSYTGILVHNPNVKRLFYLYSIRVKEGPIKPTEVHGKENINSPFLFCLPVEQFRTKVQFMCVGKKDSSY